MNPLLNISGLYKQYDSRNNSPLIRIDQFQLARGEIVGLTGPSGCGKSTILEILAMALKPDSAKVFEYSFGMDNSVYKINFLWNEKVTDIFSAIRRRHIGYVQQNGRLLPFVSARQNILLAARLKFGDSQKCQKNLEKLSELLGIVHVLDRLPQSLSYGERQRVAIARSIAHEPDIVLADEPTSALDPETAQTVMRLFNEAASEFGAALVVVSHDHELLKQAKIPIISMRKAVEHSGATSWELETRAAISPSDKPAEYASTANIGKERTRAAHLLAFLGLHDFWHDGLLSFCSVLSFASALVPILLLVGLRFGIIDHMTQRILSNPNALAINPIGSDRFDNRDIQEFAAQPGVAFLAPSTRMLSASVSVETDVGKRISADLVPTAPGDPLLKHFDLPDAQKSVAITHRLANELKLNDGDIIKMIITRMYDGRLERSSAKLPVSGIIPDYGDQQPRIYAPLPFLEAVECYRDGYMPENFWDMGNCPKRESYAGFRMYVSSLEDVLRIRDYFVGKNVEVYTFAGQIENLLALKQALLLVTIIVGGATVFGMALSLASSAIANVRNRTDVFAECLMLGFPSSIMPIFPVCQMLTRAFLAVNVSLFLYFAGSLCFDFVWRENLHHGEGVCHLSFGCICFLYGCAIMLSLLCCARASKSLLNIQLAEVLRCHA